MARLHFINIEPPIHKANQALGKHYKSSVRPKVQKLETQIKLALGWAAVSFVKVVISTLYNVLFSPKMKLSQPKIYIFCKSVMEIMVDKSHPLTKEKLSLLQVTSMEHTT